MNNNSLHIQKQEFKNYLIKTVRIIKTHYTLRSVSSMFYIQVLSKIKS